jgi:glutamine amidotransferase
MITIIDYGLGNVQAFGNIYKRLNIPARTANCVDDLSDVGKLILPGVGAFDWAMSRFNASGMRERVDDLVLNQGTPVLGVCVGMQMMARSSEEGQLPGLGWVDGVVKRFEDSRQTRLPHMGWNDVYPREGISLFRDLEHDARFYFLHSYYFVPDNEQDVLSETDYCGRYASCVGTGNMYGAQFHPEKSHFWGIQLLKNFAEM